MIDEIKIKSLTPCFISGATNSNLKYDLLRPPSIKGILRWWFRAIASPYFNLKNLKEVESILFGSTNNICPFKIQIIPLNGKSNKKNKIQDFRNLKFKSNYLWPNLILKKSHKNYIIPDTEFKIILRYNIKYLPKKYSQEIALFHKIWHHCLWLLFYLGGIGAKSRRGAGSFQATSVKTYDGMNNLLKYENHTVLDFYKNEFKAIKEDMGKLMTIFKISNPREKSNPQIFTVSQINSKIFLIKGYKTSIEALSKLESFWKEFRREQGNIEKCNLGYFGRPMISKSIKKRESYKIEDRMASPFYFSIKEFDNSYYITNVLSNTSFYKFNCLVDIRGQERTIEKSKNLMPELIENWCDFLKEKAQQQNIININF